ncbi:hypothetical protein TRM7615_01002 [Falsiruegeria mediterranea M17]|uniref:Uncharacterized protein n=2 Tax=Falsiruegeria TaxID=2854184 RepID=A0A2R8C544_9RHOB|nr:hypothetical protein TRM7615_01002 [Falsiruegeria mediterranea M17]
MMWMSKSEQNFEQFYYTKVGLGEGCGCAEKIIDVHEFNRLAGKPRLRAPRLALPTRAGLRRFLQKAGLTSRPRSRD